METVGRQPGIRASRSLISLAGGVAAVALAGFGEFLVASGDGARRALPFSLLGLLLFAVSALWMPRLPADQPAAEPDTDRPNDAARRGVGAILGAGTLLAVSLALAAMYLINKNLSSAAGMRLWLASLVTLGATGLVGSQRWGWPPRWGSPELTGGPRERWLLGTAVVLLLVLASAARLLWLDRLPYSINPDEGDRAAMSIQIVRGTNALSVFEAGWYRISIMYFWLLAQLMKLIGIGYAEARVFGALASILSVAAVTWIGIRHFGVRVGLLAGALLSLMGVSLQFARETTEAGPTAALWAISMALLLEAARRGRLWAWSGAGLAGGFSIYFYTTGRLWAVLAAVFCAYLLVHGLGGQRRRILQGASCAALAATLIAAPYLVLSLKNPDVMWLRAKDTSIFTGDNVARLKYYRPEWSTSRLILEQTVRSVGLFNRFGDQGGVWPTGRPIMGHVLAMLTLLGLGWTCLRWRDPRFVALAVWFWVGFLGVIVTVETPNLHRMATAVPVLALFPALVLDNLARRAEAFFATRRAGASQTVRWVATGLATLTAAGLMWGEARFYFVEYAKMDGWPYRRIETDAVRVQGTDTLITSLGRSSHMVNSGWIRLMAPDAQRGGIPSPGSDLPLAVPAQENLAFLVYPRQPFYLPYLRELYPGGSTQRWTHPSEGLVLTTYRLSREQWAATQGALARAVKGRSLRVATLGAVPTGWTNYVGPMRWTAGLRAPRYWNYSFQIGPGPARLAIDGKEVLAVPAGTPALTATVTLARGVHAVSYEGTLAAAGHPALFRWASTLSPGAPLDWRLARPEELTPGLPAPAGLYGIIQIPGRPEQRRIDGAIATCCLSEQANAGGRPYEAQWTGALTAPATGDYAIGLFAEGVADLKLDGRTVIRTNGERGDASSAAVRLTAGPHAVALSFHVATGPGSLEWTWTPPGGTLSIVPPSALSPPPGAGMGPPVSLGLLGTPEQQPAQSPLTTVH